MLAVKSLLLVALLVASALSQCVERGPVDVFVGDFTPLDYAIDFPAGQKAAVPMPAVTIGAKDGLTFEVQVLSRDYTGCLFAYGTPGTADYIELRIATSSVNGLGQLQFQVGTGNPVATGGVVERNKWYNVAVVVDNTKKPARATIYIDGQEYGVGTIADLPTISRSGFLSYCPSNKQYMNGALDNFIITSAKKSTQDLTDNMNFVFPFVRKNDLVQYWAFNEDEVESASPLTGTDAKTISTAPVSSPAKRVLKSKLGSGAHTTDKLCTFNGYALVTGQSVNNMKLATPYDTSRDAVYTTAFSCGKGDKLSFNQKWSNGQLVEVTIKTSLTHRWRVVARPGASVSVEHQTWGGWVRLAPGSGIIKEDRTAYSISDTQLVLQAASLGWISVTQTGGALAYQYALDTAECGDERDVCELFDSTYTKFMFNDIPLPEPMGNMPTTENPQGPPTLACPTPTLTGYNPFMYCWGWYIGPRVGYQNDWNGRPWQTSDPGCCNNPAVTGGNQWTYSRWGYLIQGQTLPWCSSNQPVPPQAPPQPLTPPPTYGEDPCKQVAADKLDEYKSTCQNLWGSITDSRYLSCVAQLCITGDPGVVPKPDCTTEKLMAKLDPNHKVPDSCLTDCTNNCNFNGKCVSGQCQCSAGWTGPDCGQPSDYACWTIMGVENALIPYQLPVAGTIGGTALLTAHHNPLYTQYVQSLTTTFAQSFAVSDTLVILLTQTIQSYTDRTPTYHLWLLSNDGNGDSDKSYSVTVNDLSGSQTQVDIYGGVSASTSRVNNEEPIQTTAVTFNFNHKKTQRGIAVVRNLPTPWSGTISVSTAGTSVPPQVLIAGQSSSPKARIDVIRVPSGSFSGISFNGGYCQNKDCPALDCKACAQHSKCGWCVENSQCMPGTASGPAFGECLNWRFSFDPEVTRRVTQIPAYPVNPGATDVYLSQSSIKELPIDIGVIPFDPHKSVWDIIIMNDYGTLNSAKWKSQIQSVLSTLTLDNSFPNSGLAFAALQTNGPYKLAKALTNPRDTAGWPDAVVVNQELIPPATGTVNIEEALKRLSEANFNDVGIRPGTRRVVIFTTTRGYTAFTTSWKTLRVSLLNKQLIPVFAVPPSLRTTYQSIVNGLRFGAVVDLVDTNLASTVRNAIVKAGKSVSVTYSEDSVNSHIDVTKFDSLADSFHVSNLNTDMRAKFSIPVKRSTAAGDDVRKTTLIFPGLGSAIIENIPTQLAERPYTTGAPQYTTFKDTPIMIELTGMSFRGLTSVFPVITKLPASGSLHWAERVTDSDGTIRWIPGSKISTINTAVASGKVIFVPPSGQTGTFELTYRVEDRCIASDEQTITVSVIPGNMPPHAEMPGVVTEQGQPVTITLLFTDDRMNEGGQYEITIVKPVDAKDGDLYEYHENFNPASPDTTYKITSPNYKLKQNRVIYVPPRFKHSQADPERTPELLILPCFSYIVTETNGEGAPLVSNEEEVIITVLHVNQPPFVWGDPEWEEIGYSWEEPPKEYCWKDCEFLEDFNEEFWWNVNFEYIYFGADDIEKSLIEFEITELDCPPNTDVRIPLVDDQNAKVGDRIRGQQPGELVAALRFKPAPETDNSIWDKGYYCRIKYRAWDEEGAASREHTITINVLPVNKQPRLERERIRVVAREGERKAFFIDVVDPDGDEFDVSFLGCDYQNKGTYQICNNAECNAPIDLDCSITDPVKLPLKGGEVVNGNLVPIAAFFQSGPVATPVDGNNYNSLKFLFNDNKSAHPARIFRVDFTVLVINNNPVLLFEEQHAPEHTRSQSATENFPLRLQAIDADFEKPGTFYQMTVTIQLDNSQTPRAEFNVQKMLDVVPPRARDTIGRTLVQFTGTYAEMNALLGAVEIVAPGNLKGDEGLVVVNVKLSDNGFVGQCADRVDIDFQPCILEDNTKINIQFVSKEDSTAVTVASSAAAAGVAGAAIIAGVALFRRFNKKAEESYAPWDEDPNDEGIATNPLYEESGNKGVNPLFEAKSEL